MSDLRRIVVADIGGTHARFALASVAAGEVVSVEPATTYRVADFPDLAAAWAQLARDHGGRLPDAASFAIAGPAGNGAFKMTNCDWLFDPARINGDLGLADHLLINDFVAVGHAVAQAGEDDVLHLAGPDQPLPATGTISIVGPGTGLGVAHVLRDAAGYHVQHTEGGHISFAPQDALEDALLARLRTQYGRVSAERVVAGPAVTDLYREVADDAGAAPVLHDARAIWDAALQGDDPLAVATVERFCMVLGSVAGDIALAQGGSAVVIAGGLGLRLQDWLRRPGFAARFTDKGRYRAMLAAMPVKLIATAEPGLFGAAAAYAQHAQRQGM